MSKRDLLIILFKWKYSLIGYFLLVVTTVTILVYLLPQKYLATAAVLIESNRAPVMRADPVFGADQINVLISEIAIINSHTVLSSAVDKVGLSEDTEPPSTLSLLLDELKNWMIEVGLREYMTPRESFIRDLEEKLDVEPLELSSVVYISMKGKNPKRVAQIVNAVTDSYIEHHLRIFNTAGTSQVYKLQIERLEQELEDKRKELADYKRKTAVAALDDTRRALVSRQNELNSELSKARRELAELETRFTPQHKKVLLAADNIESIEKSLKDTQVQLDKIELQTAKIREIEVDITTAETSLQDYQKRYEEERLNALANPDVVNVRVIEYASVPTRPNHSRLFYIVLAIVGGFMLSFAIAFVKEYFDHRISDPDVIAQLLGIQTLGSVERF